MQPGFYKSPETYYSHDHSGYRDAPSIIGSEHYNHTPVSEKRKIDRACDTCRRRKTKCDGPRKADNICTNCLKHGRACTYVEVSIPRGPPKSYVVSLEDRLEKMEEALKRLRPDQDFSDELGPPVLRDSWKNSEASSEASSSRYHSRPPPQAPQLVPYLDETMAVGISSHLNINSNQLGPSTTRRSPQQGYINSSSESSKSDSSDKDELVDNYESGMQRLTLRTDRIQPYNGTPFDRFHGQSSSIKLVDVTRKLKQAHMMAHKEGLSDDSISLSPSPDISNSLRRSEYWRAPSWELKYEGLHVDSPKLLDSVLQQLPDDVSFLTDLAEDLISLYFQHVNIHYTLLNKRIFLSQWKDRLHEKDIWFCALLLCVFAVASRWSTDCRVLSRNRPKQLPHELDWTTSGSDFFNTAVAIHRARRSLLCPATLSEVQTFSLLALYLRGTASYASGWIFVTVGLRKAQDVGAHRRAVYKRKPIANEELWKRAFWCLIVLDRTGSTSLGRPCGIGEEDFDLDLPTEVDDDYWDTENPPLAFKQPDGLPSKVIAFNLWIKITQIVAFTLRTLYALDPKKIFLGRQTLPHPETIVKQLDIALAEWVNSVPEHLQWSNQSPNSDLTTSNLSASLHLSYHHTLILIYRIFIPFSKILPPDIRGLIHHRSSDRRPSSLSVPALTICVNAAKACARIVEEQRKRGFSNVPFLITISYVCTGILIVNLWDMKAKDLEGRSTRADLMEDVKPQYAPATQSAKEDITIFLDALEWAKPRYPSVTQMLDNLRASFPNDQTDLRKRDQYLPRQKHTGPSPPAWNSSGMPSDTFLSSSWESHHNSPLRNDPHPALRRLPSHSLNRHDSGTSLQQLTAFWPASQSSPSYPRVSANRHPTFHSSLSEQGSLPFISSVRRASSTVPQRSFHGRHASPSPTRRDQHTSFYNPYHVYTGDDGRDLYQHLPTSDARSIPTLAHEKLDYNR